jgi:hypothetical protein
MFLKLSDISFYEDPFSCSRVTCKWTERVSLALATEANSPEAS